MAEFKTVDSEIKIVVVGNGGVGKTCMIKCCIYDEFPLDFTPTVFDAPHKSNIEYDGK